ncbi:hypothetical protein HanIR_Chr13g0628951 [Helianthus annuus]|nr:hypothetical protein HanIR_Chr13g0628951 [Helianthus annuus]
MVHTIVLHCKHMMDKGRHFVLHSTHMRWVVHAMIPHNKCMKVVAHILTPQSMSVEAHILVHQSMSMRKKVHTFGLHRMCMKIKNKKYYTKHLSSPSDVRDLGKHGL